MSELFFTSDEHLGHRNIIEFCKRPFSSVEEMTEILRERHNKKVPRGARVIHLGDMFWRNFGIEAARKYIDSLNGEHYYITGNHEELMDSNVDLRSRFRVVEQMYEVKYHTLPKIILCHYPLRSWNGSHRGSWHLYGHEHGQLRENDSLSFDVGVDCWNFEPVSIEEVAAKMLPKMEAMRARDLKRIEQNMIRKAQEAA